VRILYYETTAHYPSSAHFLEAMRAVAAQRSDFVFDFFDEARFIRGRSLRARIAARMLKRRPRRFSALNRAFVERARRFAPDIALIAKGSRLSPSALREIKQRTGATLINWATDDPFNSANSSANLIASIPLYDLYASPRTAALPDLARHGARETAYVRFGYKPEFHYPESAADRAEAARYDCDVAFIGGADPDRAPWFEHLPRAVPGIRLNLYGAYWNRHPALRQYWRGEAAGRDYRLALGGCAMAVNLVRRSNRDDHVMRTFEAPACGAFVLAERTPTHLELFEEDREAVFFSSPEELAARVREYLPRAADRRLIADAGHRRIVNGAHSYRDRLTQILALAGEIADRGARGRSPVRGAVA
jgi:spore maturation protein CgeB